MESGELAKRVAKTVDYHKGEDIRLYDVTNKTPLASYYLVITASGSKKKVEGFADLCEELIEKNGGHIGHIEGRNGSEWVLIDAGDIIVCVMSGEERARLDFDALFRRCPEVDYLQAEVFPEGE